ncbi:cell wall hydrolase [Hydrogenispora sp. UU3]|uniref:Cell wall hydrolase n=2 Tax=Capillibacterium thermochitinicola TaxID=2699427 RepID=A0A8J6HZM1_9FIRM|nr:cell wall hydrolase [Capillibacterium thermochitinicola]
MGEKVELTAGVELRLNQLIPGLSVALEGRLVTANLVGEQNQLAPFFGFALHFGATPVEVRTPRGVDEDLYLLAKLIRAEAEGEPYEGQVAVGAVVLNRVKSPQFPNTIYDVIYQPGQFSCLPKLATIQPNEESLRAARDALAGKDPSRGALYYYNPKLASPAGKRFFRTANLTPTVVIGNHHFFK